MRQNKVGTLSQWIRKTHHLRRLLLLKLGVLKDEKNDEKLKDYRKTSYDFCLNL